MAHKDGTISTDVRGNHARAMRSPLRRIIGAQQADTWSTGESCYRMLLECGHTNEIISPETAEAFARQGRKKRCLVCGDQA